MENLTGFLPQQRGRTQAMARLLGCSNRTAQRLLNTPAEELPRLNRSYLETAVAETGHAATHLLRKASTESSEVHMAMGRLERANAALDRFREMSLLAAAMAARCGFGYNMPVSFGVEVNISCEPTHLYLKFRRQDSCGDVHQLSVRRDPDTGRWCMHYSHPHLGSRFKGALSENNFERVLKYVNS